MNAVTKNSQIL